MRRRQRLLPVCCSPDRAVGGRDADDGDGRLRPVRATPLGGRRRNRARGALPLAVTETPRQRRAARSTASGSRRRTASSLSSSTSRSKRPAAARTTGQCAANSGGGSTGTGVSAGRSISTCSPSTVASSQPLLVEKRAWPSSRRPACARAWAVATVACPQSSTSDTGVNHRRPNASPSGHVKAVSDRLSSRASACIPRSGPGPARRHTAAGLPVKGPSQNASTQKGHPRVGHRRAVLRV